jgi:hypothetical protein
LRHLVRLESERLVPVAMSEALLKDMADAAT